MKNHIYILFVFTIMVITPIHSLGADEPTFSHSVNCNSYKNFSACVSHPDTKGKILVIDKSYATNGLKINDRGLRFTEKGRLTITSGNLFHNGPFTAPMLKIISGPGRFEFGRLSGVKEVLPQWFGFASGAHDNTYALQSAIDSLPGGGTVRLTGKGTYLTGRIFPRSGVSIIGDSWNVVLKLMDNRNSDLIREEYTTFVNDVRISGFSIDGNKANNPSKFAGTAIHFGGINIIVDNMNIYNTAAASIILGVPTGGGKYVIRDNHILNASGPEIGWGGIAVTGGEDADISGNEVICTDGYQAYGIDLEPNPGWVVKSVRIKGNRVVHGRISIGVSDSRAITENVSVENNSVNGLGAFGSAYDNGSAIYASSVGGQLLIMGNEIWSPDQSSGGMRIENTNNFFVKNNTIYVHKHKNNESEIGTWIIDSHHGIIAGNIFRTMTGNKARFGIYEQGKSDYNIYTGNNFSGFAVNYQLRGTHNRVEKNPL